MIIWLCLGFHVYLVFHQHGDINKHVMKLLDAAFQPHDVFVTGLDLVQGLLVNLGLCDLQKETETKNNKYFAGLITSRIPMGFCNFAILNIRWWITKQIHSFPFFICALFVGSSSTLSITILVFFEWHVNFLPLVVNN